MLALNSDKVSQELSDFFVERVSSVFRIWWDCSWLPQWGCHTFLGLVDYFKHSKALRCQFWSTDWTVFHFLSFDVYPKLSYFVPMVLTILNALAHHKLDFIVILIHSFEKTNWPVLAATTELRSCDLLLESIMNVLIAVVNWMPLLEWVLISGWYKQRWRNVTGYIRTRSIDHRFSGEVHFVGWPKIRNKITRRFCLVRGSLCWKGRIACWVQVFGFRAFEEWAWGSRTFWVWLGCYFSSRSDRFRSYGWAETSFCVPLKILYYILSIILLTKY